MFTDVEAAISYQTLCRGDELLCDQHHQLWMRAWYKQVLISEYMRSIQFAALITSFDKPSVSWN